jgi:hypothetical protein
MKRTTKVLMTASLAALVWLAVIVCWIVSVSGGAP